MLILIFKSLHIISIIVWLGCLFHMLSLFVSQTEALKKQEPDRSLLIRQSKRMAKKIWLPVGWTSALFVLIFGAGMMHPYLSQDWFQVKLVLVLLLYIFYHWVHFTYKRIQRDIYKYSVFKIGLFGDVLIVLLMAIVFLTVLKTNINYTFLGIALTGFLIVLLVRTWFYNTKKRN